MYNLTNFDFPKNHIKNRIVHDQIAPRTIICPVFIKALHRKQLAKLIGTKPLELMALSPFKSVYHLKMLHNSDISSSFAFSLCCSYEAFSSLSSKAVLLNKPLLLCKSLLLCKPRRGFLRGFIRGLKSPSFWSHSGTGVYAAFSKPLLNPSPLQRKTKSKKGLFYNRTIDACRASIYIIQQSWICALFFLKPLSSFAVAGFTYTPMPMPMPEGQGQGQGRRRGPKGRAKTFGHSASIKRRPLPLFPQYCPFISPVLLFSLRKGESGGRTVRGNKSKGEWRGNKSKGHLERFNKNHMFVKKKYFMCSVVPSFWSSSGTALQGKKAHKYFLSDFVEIQRKSFLMLLQEGLIEEFSKRNPITNTKKNLELFFYPSYYQLTPPTYRAAQAILNSKTYECGLYVPVQLTDKKASIIKLKWVYIGNLPLMTKRGHFILNGAPRVIVNQMIRSPGIYYQRKNYDTYTNKWSQKVESTFKRFYADLICQRGTWLRIEIDKEKLIWAQLKKGPKIPILWLLLAMGLTETIIFKSITESSRLLLNFQIYKNSKKKYQYIKTPPEACAKIYNLFFPMHAKKNKNTNLSKTVSQLGRSWIFNKFMNPRTYDLGKKGRISFNTKLGLTIDRNQCTLTAQDLLFATDYLIKVEKGLYPIDDIDHLKNRRVRTSGELLQIQIGIGLVRLEKLIRDKINKVTSNFFAPAAKKTLKRHLTLNNQLYPPGRNDALLLSKPLSIPAFCKPRNSFAVAGFTYTPLPLPLPYSSFFQRSWNGNPYPAKLLLGLHICPKGKEGDQKEGHGHGHGQKRGSKGRAEKLTISQLINSKAFNGALREFFGSSALSQFMDQINPLSELTHKRRLSSMGPGGVTRDNATLAIRGIHPTHYGRICPVETPEGKNTGLVNSITTYARVNPEGLIETPFYKVYKGQVQKKTGMFFLSAEQEEKIKLAAADLYVSDLGFLPKSSIPVRIAEEFTKISRSKVQYIGVSTVQMISIATSLIPFLEHDDANRALMGSNMQRQAVPLIKAERPIVGTGLEARAVSDSGHVLQAKYSGYIAYVSAKKIIILSPFFSKKP